MLIVGGSRGMTGAVALAGLGALRGGAGLVFLAVPESSLAIVAGLEASYLTISLPEDARGCLDESAQEILETVIPRHSAVALGPGLGQSETLAELACRVYQRAEVPLVIDADGLNGIACHVEAAAGDGELPKLPARHAKGPSPAAEFPRVLTPHPGEFARLLQCDIAIVQSRREELAVRFAGENNVILVLKGHRTLVTDGDRVALNTTGNNGMATGGSGDVLTGLITALLAQRMPAFAAAQLGVHLHGLAGDLAAAELTQPAMIASDLPRFLPQAWRKLSAD